LLLRPLHAARGDNGESSNDQQKLFSQEEEMKNKNKLCTCKIIILPIIGGEGGFCEKNIQSVPKRCIHKVNIPYYNVFSSFWDILYIMLTKIC
jgi:hypothetical protein